MRISDTHLRIVLNASTDTIIGCVYYGGIEMSHNLKLGGLVLASLFMNAIIAAQSDPFVGTWVYNAQKSPKPTITYGIMDLGGDRYALTGSTGETIAVKADGVPSKSPSGATVSFKKLDDHTWQMDRIESRTMLRTYSVSADDKTLTLHDVFTTPDGSKQELTTIYARTSLGKSIFGKWKSISMDGPPATEPEIFVIQPYRKDGLTFISDADKHRTDMNFDGKQYFDVAPDGTKGDSYSGKRIGANLIQLEGQSRGKPDEDQELKMSDDGKTLTIVNKALKNSAIFTSVWDKQ
jgi:hypothetical protein